MKSGVKTTEFWLVGVPGLILTIGEVLTQAGLGLPSWAGTIMTVAYAISRGMGKLGGK